MKGDLVDQLGFEVRAAQAAVDELDETAAKALGVNRTDMRCLDILDREGPLTAGHLATKSGLTTAAVTAVLDRLERAGYARRVRDEQDRRKVHVELTPLAEERIVAIWGPFMQMRAELERRYTARDLEVLLDFHKRARQYNEERAAAVRELRFD
jgi:DNA-binding MarR family transcriptional regulator